MRRALLLAFAVSVLGACGGADDDELFTPEATTAADAFVRTFVAEGSANGAARFAARDVGRSLAVWHAYLIRDGVRTVEGPGSPRSSCVKPFPVFAPRREGDCIVYRLVGLMPWPGTSKTLMTTARFRVWLGREGGAWKITEFDYTPHLETR